MLYGFSDANKRLDDTNGPLAGIRSGLPISKRRTDWRMERLESPHIQFIGRKIPAL